MVGAIVAVSRLFSSARARAGVRHRIESIIGLPRSRILGADPKLLHIEVALRFPPYYVAFLASTHNLTLIQRAQYVVCVTSEVQMLPLPQYLRWHVHKERYIVT